jgi:hypothetical protein
MEHGNRCTVMKECTDVGEGINLKKREDRNGDEMGRR